LADFVICEISLKNDVFSDSKDILQSLLEEFWLDFCNFIELNPSVLKYGLIIFFVSNNDYVNHIFDQILEFLSINLLNSLQVVAQSLKRSKFNIKFIMS